MKRARWILAVMALAALGAPAPSLAAGPTAIAVDSGGTVYTGFSSGAVRRYRASDGEALAGWQTQVVDADGSLGGIVGMDVGPAGGLPNGGAVWVLDTNRRVQEFNREGEYIRGFQLTPCEGSNDPIPAAKGGIDVTATAIYVAHPCDNVVARFPLSELPAAGVGAPSSIATPIFWPHGIAAPLTGTGFSDTQALYVTQPRSSAIRRFDLSTLAQIGDAVPITHTGSPEDVHVSGDADEARVLVSEAANTDPGYAHRIYAFGSTAPGTFTELFNFGGQGTTPGRLDGAVAFDGLAGPDGISSATVVVDRENERIQRLTSSSADNGTVTWVSSARDPGPPPTPASEGGSIGPDDEQGPDRRPGVRISGGARYTPTPGVVLSLDEPRGTDAIEIANTARFKSAERFPAGSETLDWKLGARKPDSVRRRVFARFLGSGRNVVSDEIRLDRGRPKIRSARITEARSGWVLRVVAADAGSGLSELRVSPSPEGPFQERSFEPRTALEHARDARWVRVADLVGNASTTVRARRAEG